jgi:transcription elongation GreA/GreB family factor
MEMSERLKVELTAVIEQRKAITKKIWDLRNLISAAEKVEARAEAMKNGGAANASQ